jgi:regulator of sigma E protease
MNLVLGFILIIVTTLLYGSLGNLTVADFRTNPENEAECIAMSAETGLQKGDTILKINGMRILTDTDLSYKLSTNESDTMQVVVRRDGKKVTLDNVTFRNKLNGTRLDFYVQGVKLNPLNVISYSFLDTISTARLIWSSLRDLLTGKYGFHDLSGPVGIVTTIGEAAQYGETFKQHLESVLGLASFITVNVGVFNLLPIPALDGARIVFLVVEGIRRKPIPPEKEGMVHFAGMALLFLLMIAVSIQDILRLFEN